MNIHVTRLEWKSLKRIYLKLRCLCAKFQVRHEVNTFNRIPFFEVSWLENDES